MIEHKRTYELPGAKEVGLVACGSGQGGPISTEFKQAFIDKVLIPLKDVFARDRLAISNRD